MSSQRFIPDGNVDGTLETDGSLDIEGLTDLDGRGADFVGSADGNTYATNEGERLGETEGRRKDGVELGLCVGASFV